MTASIISSRELHRVLDGPPPEKSEDHALNELRKLSRDLLAIRQQIDNHLKGSKITEEWKTIATVLDRVLFGLYFIFLAVSFITILALTFSSRFP